MCEEEQETDNEVAKCAISTKTIAASLKKRRSGSISIKSRSRSVEGERRRIGGKYVRGNVKK